MHRSWVNLPHVTHFDDADITELEAFRKSLKNEAEARGVKATPLPFCLRGRDSRKYDKTEPSAIRSVLFFPTVIPLCNKAVSSKSDAFIVRYLSGYIP